MFQFLNNSSLYYATPQIVRAADSIGANIAEGTGRYNYQDNKRFVKIARGSLNETIHWLRRAYTRNLLTEEQVNKLKLIIDDLSPKLNTYLKSIGNQPSTINNERLSTKTLDSNCYPTPRYFRR